MPESLRSGPLLLGKMAELLRLSWEDVNLEAGTLQVCPDYVAMRETHWFKVKVEGFGLY